MLCFHVSIVYQMFYKVSEIKMCGVKAHFTFFNNQVVVYLELVREFD